jgi:hypothetical protein
MNKLSPTGKWTIIAVVIVLAVVLIVVYGGSENNNAAPASNSASSSTTGATASDNSSTPGATPSTGKTNTAGTVVTHPQSSGGITLMTPVPGDTWVIDTQNAITWSKAAGVPTGEIELLNASTKDIVGIILNDIGQSQTSYTWNTRDLLQSLTSPNKITVTPGQYVIRVIFNGNDLAPLTSQPFTIAQ